MPSSVVDDDNGGDGVAERKEDAPELESTGEGSCCCIKRCRCCCSTDAGAELPDRAGAGECGLQDNFMRRSAAEHSVMTSSSLSSPKSRLLNSSGMCSLVRRFRLLEYEMRRRNYIRY